MGIQNRCAMAWERSCVAGTTQGSVLQELHKGHPGMTKMKAFARMYVWWPGINADIEKSVRLCSACQEVQSAPPVAPLNT